MIGGEGPADPIWMSEGTWVSQAQRLNAYLIFLEHRFYGKSHPTEDMSLDNLAFLTSEQALADIATFTVAMKEELGLSDNKWIAFGGSYSGSLVAWYRMKYPHLVHGAVATSAPIFAKVNFTEYLEVVQKSLATASEECNGALRNATLEMHYLMRTKLGWEELGQLFRLCSPLNGTNELDVSNLFEVLAENIENVVQYNKDNRAFEGAKGTNITIDTICDIMVDKTKGTAISRYADVNDMLLNIYGGTCLEHTYDSMIKSLQSTSWGNSSNAAGRAWFYQTCTEFGWYQSSDSKDQPFGSYFPLKFFTQQCQDVYGQSISDDVLKAGVERTNTMYGGRDLKVSRVVFPNGAIDPWHALGVTSNISSEAPAIFIEGTAHCADMYPAASDDPPQLTQAREEIFTLLQKWLQE